MESLEERRLLAVDLTFLGDQNIRPEPLSSSPRDFAVVGSTMFFQANSGAGAELWRTNGTSATTVQVKDIAPGADASDPRQLTNVAGTLFFTATTPLTGRELWKSDGTEAGTLLVKESVAGAASSSPNSLTAVGQTLFFSSLNDAGVRELWKTDGSDGGTVRVKSFQTGPSSSFPVSLVNWGGTLFFTVDSGSDDHELWKSDGTEGGTVRVKQWTTANGWGIGGLTVVGERLFLAVNDVPSNSSLWQSDGTEAGTNPVTSVEGAAVRAPANLTNVGGMLLFRAASNSAGQELWKSDGTPAGTMMVKDIYPGATGSSLPTSNKFTTQSFTAVGETLYFAARSTPANGGIELWKSDGTEAGTVRVKDIRFGPGWSYPSYLTNVDGVLYFQAEASTADGFELWKSDGTEVGTIRVKDILPGKESSDPRVLTNFNGTLFFRANDGGYGGIELWKSDGTETGTVMIDIRYGTAGGFPSNFIEFNGRLIYTLSATSGGNELWTSDGTQAGAIRLKQGLPNTDVQLTNVAGTLFFVGYEAATGSELWKTDGTPAGTTLVKDIHPGNSSRPTGLTNLNGVLYFAIDDGVNGNELWRSDGTAAGTFLVHDIAAGPAPSSPRGMTNVDGTLYFSAADRIGWDLEYELWKSDGTAAGTVLVKEISLDYIDWRYHSAVSAGGLLYFTFNDGTSGEELWRSDGTTAGTYLVKDIIPGAGYLGPDLLTNVNGVLYFTAGDDLWKTDGTEGGTVRLYDFPTYWKAIRNLYDFQGTLFFSANDGSTGFELWKSDGTAAGTVRVKDIVAGANSSEPAAFVDVEGKLYFQVGRTIWTTDGTEAGTTLVFDLATHTPSEFQFDPTFAIGEKLFFAGYTQLHGSELWVLDLNSPPVAGDYDGNGRVDGGDFLAWQRGFGGSATPAGSGADGDASGTVDAGDLAIWKGQFGAGSVSNVVQATELAAPLAVAVAESSEDVGEAPRRAAALTVAPAIATAPALDGSDLAGLAQRAAREETTRSRGAHRLPVQHDPEPAACFTRRRPSASLDAAFASFDLPAPSASLFGDGKLDLTESVDQRGLPLRWATIGDRSRVGAQRSE